MFSPVGGGAERRTQVLAASFPRPPTPLTHLAEADGSDGEAEPLGQPVVSLNPHVPEGQQAQVLALKQEDRLRLLRVPLVRRLQSK